MRNKTVWLLLAIILVLLMETSCSREKPPILGKWKSSTTGAKFEFFSNHKCKYEAGSIGHSCTWKPESDDKIKIEHSISGSGSYYISEGQYFPFTTSPPQLCVTTGATGIDIFIRE